MVTKLLKAKKYNCNGQVFVFQ